MRKRFIRAVEPNPARRDAFEKKLLRLNYAFEERVIEDIAGHLLEKIAPNHPVLLAEKLAQDDSLSNPKNKQRRRKLKKLRALLEMQMLLDRDAVAEDIDAYIASHIFVWLNWISGICQDVVEWLVKNIASDTSRVQVKAFRDAGIAQRYIELKFSDPLGKTPGKETYFGRIIGSSPTNGFGGKFSPFSVGASGSGSVPEGVGGQLSGFFGQGKPDEAIPTGSGIAPKGTTKWNRKRAKGVPFISVKADSIIPDAIKNATELITKMSAKDLDKLQVLLQEFFTKGGDYNDIQALLGTFEGFSRRRAKNVARDQVGKITQAISRANVEALGLTQAQWIHVPGQFTSRETHIEMNGKQFDLRVGLYDNDPKVQKNVVPGELYYCRCTFRTIIPAEFFTGETTDEKQK